MAMSENEISSINEELEHIFNSQPELSNNTKNEINNDFDGCIYRLSNEKINKIYVGSTVDLGKRIKGHHSDYYRERKYLSEHGKHKEGMIASYEIFDDNLTGFKVDILEVLYEKTNRYELKQELKEREKFYMLRLPNTLNKVLPSYNPKKVYTWYNKYEKCICGEDVSIIGVRGHKESQVHRDYLASLTDDIVPLTINYDLNKKKTGIINDDNDNTEIVSVTSDNDPDKITIKTGYIYKLCSPYRSSFFIGGKNIYETYKEKLEDYLKTLKSDDYVSSSDPCWTFKDCENSTNIELMYQQDSLDEDELYNDLREKLRYYEIVLELGIISPKRCFCSDNSFQKYTSHKTSAKHINFVKNERKKIIRIGKLKDDIRHKITEHIIKMNNLDMSEFLDNRTDIEIEQEDCKKRLEEKIAKEKEKSRKIMKELKEEKEKELGFKFNLLDEPPTKCKNNTNIKQKETEKCLIIDSDDEEIVPDKEENRKNEELEKLKKPITKLSELMNHPFFYNMDRWGNRIRN